MLPFLDGQSTVGKVSASKLAAVAEEAVIVVGVLQGEDGFLDEGVEGLEMTHEGRGEIEIHDDGWCWGERENGVGEATVHIYKEKQWK